MTETDKCPRCDVGDVVDHCENTQCTWKKCVQCRAYGPPGKPWAPHSADRPAT